jgi:hypothetical protein
LKKKFSIFNWVYELVYDNSFFHRLFPLINQQKPGKDLYVWIATIQIITIFYLFCFYS